MMLRRVFVAAVVLAAAALVGSATIRAADPKYFPSDTEIVFTINLKQILDSDLVKAQKDSLDQAKAMLASMDTKVDTAYKNPNAPVTKKKK